MSLTSKRALGRVGRTSDCSQTHLVLVGKTQRISEKRFCLLLVTESLSKVMGWVSGVYQPVKVVIRKDKDKDKHKKKLKTKAE